MVVDTSAVVAILFGEPEAERFAALIEQDRVRLMSAVSAFEASIVIASELGGAGLSELDLLLLRIGMVVEPLGVDQLSWARAAYLQFGKGRHPAGLNFGDCFAYALSRVRNQPLLFKGDDFARTDVRAVGGAA